VLLGPNGLVGSWSQLTTTPGRLEACTLPYALTLASNHAALIYKGLTDELLTS
jgi:hypothetical protein